MMRQSTLLESRRKQLEERFAEWEELTQAVEANAT
jgi:hypothetical protein